MKGMFFLISSLCLLAASCTCKEGIRNGDLLFVGLEPGYRTGSMSDGIGAATGTDSTVNWIHTAILEVEKDSVWIIDATIKRGVARYPLDTFLCDFTLSSGSLPILEVKRITDGRSKPLPARRMRDFIAKAKTFVGEGYDVNFLPDNGKSYCTELVYNSCLDASGRPVFHSAPMNFLAPDGTMPAYWEKLFASIGATVPQGIDGTNPRAMREEACLVDVKLPDGFFKAPEKPAAAAPAVEFSSSEIPASVLERMKGKSYPEGCPVSLSDLRYLRLSYHGFDGEVHTGEMVCNRIIADDLVAIFKELYDSLYQIRSIRLIDDFDGSDEKSMAADNSSCFNFREATGQSRLSAHAVGMAVDVNPLENPYVKGDKVLPAEGAAYADRSAALPHMISRNDLCYKLFRARGFSWGGAWQSCKDWQHFERKY